MRRHGAFHCLALGLGNRCQRIIDAVGRQRPTVILAALDDVDFITTAWAVFVFPDGATPGVQRQALRVALAVGPDLGAYTLLANERVILWHAAVREDPHHFALQLVQLLGSRAITVFTPGHQHPA